MSNVYIMKSVCISITHGRYLEAMEQLQENLEEYDKLQNAVDSTTITRES